ncbi:peptide cleavage/export ABC transporter [Lactobacillus intestinalis]|uniref:peptide cleavage/export ABC transporter n=1 Tax=Lactobacillus intestinalis TaxID=151781 RepID=UPI0026EC3927|nr:peptide cleavage/export ABC transporter [Lactobacillus intestinalis]
MINKDYVAQVDETDCGAACLAMVLKHYNSNVSIAYVRNLAHTDMKGTTALGLVKTAQKLGFETKAIKADMSLFDGMDIPLPCIVHVVKDNLLHYYVVLKVKKKYLLIADPDPSVKVTKISKRNFEKQWSGIAIFMVPEPDYKPLKQSRHTLFSFLPRIFRQRKLVINIILAALLITVISIVGSYFLQTVIDTYIPNNMHNTLIIIALGLFVFYVFQSIFTYAQNFLLTIFGQRFSIDIILGYIRHIFTLPMDFFATRRTGEITSRFSDANKIIDALASAVVSIFLDLAIIIIMGVILAVQNTVLFGITMVSLPIYIIIITSFINKFEKLNQKEMESGAILSSSVIEDIRGIETIKSLNSEDEQYFKVDTEFVDYLRKSLKYSKADILQQALKLVTQLSLTLVVLTVGAILVMHNKLSVGQLMTYDALLGYFINPLQNVINLQTKLQSARVANNRLNEVYLVKSEFDKKRPIKNANQLIGPIAFKKVKYQYGYGQLVLKDINFQVKPNEKLTIVGMSGSGKSTLMKLLVGFFEPTGGTITLNNHSINEINRHALRTYINYTPQDPYVFSGTILDNLKLGNRFGITQEDVVKACKIAMIYKDIEKMPLQFNTKLDEEGSILSGGQKQRLTIARALLSPARVLILDEATSGLDAITERKLVDNLMKLDNITIIFIAHRLAIARRTNNIVVLDDGKIVEQGSHKELLTKHGYYYDLVEG